MDGRKRLGGLLRLAAAASVAAGLSSAPARAQQAEMLVFAAASLKNALDAGKLQWRKETGRKAAISDAAGSALGKEIEQGAPAQMFVSADVDWMDHLARKHPPRADTRPNLPGNRVVLIAAKDKAAKVDIKPGFGLGKLLSAGRLSMADVDAVPAGEYDTAALPNLGLWASASNTIAEGEIVRAALLLVSRGEAPAGSVDQTRAADDRNVASIGTLPDAARPPITYPVALTANAIHPDAAALLAHIPSARATIGFEAQGRAVLSQGRS